MKEKKLRPSVRAAFCGILTSLAVVFLLIVPLVPIAVYCCPVLSGICVALAAEEFGVKYASMVYFAASVLSMIIAADKEAVSVFVFLMGAYPILRKLTTNLSLRIRLIIKLVYINIASAAYYFAAVMILGVPRDSFGAAPLILLAAANVLMLTYDKAIRNIMLLYTVKFRKRILKGTL